MDESSFAFDRLGHLVVRPTFRPHSDQHPLPVLRFDDGLCFA